MASWAGPEPWGLQDWDTGARWRLIVVEEGQEENLEETLWTVPREVGRCC